MNKKEFVSRLKKLNEKSFDATRIKELRVEDVTKGTILGWDYGGDGKPDLRFIVLKTYKVSSVEGELDYLLLGCLKCKFEVSFSILMPLWLMSCPVCGSVVDNKGKEDD